MTSWPVTPIGSVVTVVGGGTPQRSELAYYGGNIPWVTPKDMKTWNIHGSKVHLTQLGLVNSPAKLVPEGSVLIVVRSGVLKHSVPIGIARNPVALNQDMKALVCSKNVLPEYLARFIQACSSRVLTWVRATTADNFPIEKLKDLNIPIPPIDDQQRIVEKLSLTDELREKRREASALLDNLAQSIFLDMFEDLPSGFETVSVGDLATNIRTGPFGSDLLHSEFVDDGIAVLGIDNAVNNEFTWSQRRFITNEKYQKLVRYRVHAGDLVITIMGTCGRCAIVPDDIPVAINTKHLCCITLDKSRCLPEFLHAYFLMHPTARRYLEQTAKGAIMSGLNATIIKSLPVQLPPFADQERFAKTSLQLREQKRRLSGQAQELDELFKSLQQRAFGNEL